MTVNVEEIKNAIESCETLSDLEARLDGKIDLDSARGMWQRYRVADFDFTIAEVDDLPVTKVQKDDISYKIHGIVHLPLIKNFVRGTAELYHKPEAGEDYICEERFSNLFGLGKENEMDDITATSRDQGFLKAFLISLLIQLQGALSLSRVYYSYPKMQFFPDKIPKDIWNDIRYLSGIREFYRRASFPEPLDMLYQYKKTEESWHGLTLNPAYRDASYPERSLYMANYMQKFAKENNLHTLHAIVGLIHEPQIEYFLRHSEYSLPKSFNEVKKWKG